MKNLIKQQRPRGISYVVIFAMLLGVFAPWGASSPRIAEAAASYPVKLHEMTNKSFYFGNYKHYNGRGSMMVSGSATESFKLNDTDPRPVLWDFKGNDGSANVALSRYAVEGEMYFNGNAAWNAPWKSFDPATGSNYNTSAIRSWLNGSAMNDVYGQNVPGFLTTNHFSTNEMDRGLIAKSVTNTSATQKVFLPWATGPNGNDTTVHWSSNGASSQLATGTGWAVVPGAETGWQPQAADAKVRGNDGKGTPPHVGSGANGTGAVSYLTRSAANSSWALALLTPDGWSEPHPDFPNDPSKRIIVDSNNHFNQGYAIRPLLSLDINNIVWLEKVNSGLAPNFIEGGSWNNEPAIGNFDANQDNWRLVIVSPDVGPLTKPNGLNNIAVTPGTTTFNTTGWGVPSGAKIAYKILDNNGNMLKTNDSGKSITYAGGYGTVNSGSITINIPTGLTVGSQYSVVFWPQKDNALNSHEAGPQIMIPLTVGEATPRPTLQPTARPTAPATALPTHLATAIPTASPTASPTAPPTLEPTATPSAQPTPPTDEVTVTILRGTIKYLRDIEIPSGYTWVNENDYVSEEGSFQKPAIYNGMNTHITVHVIVIDPSPTPEIPPLITDDHFQYMHGYPEGDFRPAGSMTRAEAAAMFARLMVESMYINHHYQATFSDVKPSDWFYREVEYLASYGIINGYDEKGGGRYFNPQGYITRAEFAKMASKFNTAAVGNYSNSFKDVPSNHWALYYINSVASAQWVKGYEDGTFRPNSDIRRVEVVTIVNRMVNRVFDPTYEERYPNSLLKYTDLVKTYWGYGDIMEASNGHDFLRLDNGDEEWTGLRPKK